VPNSVQTKPLIDPAPFDATSASDAISRWPRETPLVCLVSAGELNTWNRYSIFATPVSILTHDPSTKKTHRLDLCPNRLPHIEFSHDPLEDLARILGISADADAEFAPGWIGSLAYELGFAIEPAARRRTGPEAASQWPLFTLMRIEGAIVHDRLNDSWFIAGEPSAIPSLTDTPDNTACACSTFTSATGRTNYERAVARAVEYTHAGDIFQANIAHRLTASFTGNPRGALLRSLEGVRPWFGGYCEIPGPHTFRDCAVLSSSPELFFSLDKEGAIVTRPIKGTAGERGEGGALLASEKDAAELAMIVDLMRNDLSRVCSPGTVRVTSPRELERHAHDPAIHHTTATIRGTLRDGASRTDALLAAFPPGSITGAPKVRAMQIIDELEPGPRGPYTGSFVLCPDNGSMSASVAIRTAALTRTGPDAFALDYHAGAGIVADSNPHDEWLETLDKASAFVRALGSDIRVNA